MAEIDVLVVDDDAAARMVYKHVGSQVADHVHWVFAQNGEEALDYLRRDGQTCLILMDWHLPGMHGREVLEAVKTDSKLRHIPVCVVSHSTYDKDTAEALRLGAEAFIEKPIEIDSLAATLRQVIESWCKKGWRDAQTAA